MHTRVHGGWFIMLQGCVGAVLVLLWALDVLCWRMPAWFILKVGELEQWPPRCRPMKAPFVLECK